MTTNFEQSMSDNILKTIDILVDKKLDELEYNTTINGQIVDASKAEKGVYTVKYETSTFTAYTTDTSLIENDIVQVLISHNNSNDTRIILNKIVAHEDEYLTNTTFKDYINVTGNLTDVILDTNKSILANGGIEEKLLWQYSDSKDLKSYTQIKLEVDIQTLLNNAVKGNFGLKLEIITDTEIIELLFSNNEMLGNSFNYVSYTKQQKIFNLSKLNFTQINGISLYLYQEANSFYDKNDNLLTAKDSLGHSLPSNIFVNNINLSFGYNINDYTPGSDIATISLLPDYSETFNEETEEIICELSWIHWNDDNTAIIPLEDLLKADNYHIEWYYYQQYSNAVAAIQKQRELYEGSFTPGFSQEYYDILENRLIDNLGCVYNNNNNWQHLENFDDQFSCEFYPNADSNTEERIKAFIILDNGNNILESNELLLKNENTPNIISTDNKTGIEFICSDGLNGNYYLYTPSGILNNEDTKTRVLEVVYYDTNGMLVDDLVENDNYTIAWDTLPTNNTMLASCEYGTKPTEIIYSIKNQYEPTAVNNTIGCTITYSIDGLNYSEHKSFQTFNFGYSNVSNADQTLVIKFDNPLGSLNNIYYTKNALEINSKEEWFRVDKYDSNGQSVNISDSDIEWYLYAYSIETDEDGQQTINKQIFTINDEEDVLQSIDYNKVKINFVEGFDFKYLLFLEAKVDNASVKYPIPISKDNIKYNHISGATSIIYQTIGVPLYNKESYALYDYNCELSNEINYKWKCIGDSWYELTEDYIINPPLSYLKDPDNDSAIGVIYTSEEDDIIWMQPIVVLETQFSSPTLSQWDGASVLQDDDNGTLTAPRLAAGRKEEDKFTGVVIGDWQQDGEDGSCTGVYGFKQGKSVYGLRDDGTAFLGAESGGRILFDGNQSTITSSKYLSDSMGLFMDLDDALFIASSKQLIISESSEEEGNGTINSELLCHIQIDAQHENYPLLIGPQGDEVFKIKWDGTGEFKGTIYAQSGQIGGWNISPFGLASPNSQYFLNTINNSGVLVKLGENFLIDSEGVISVTDLIINGTAQLEGNINNLFQIVQIPFNFYFSSGTTKTVKIETECSLEGYSLAGIVGVKHNASKSYVKISSVAIDPEEETVCVYLCKHNYSKAIGSRNNKKRGVIYVLFLRAESELLSFGAEISGVDGEGHDGSDEDYEIPVIGGGNASTEPISISGYAPTIHASAASTYGVATSTEYGHIMVKQNQNDSNYLSLSNGILRFDNAIIDDLISDVKTLRNTIVNIPDGMHPNNIRLKTD